MPTSYQDMDVRLVGLENALMFLMQSIKVKQAISSPLAVAPIVREISMLDYYREQLVAGILEPHVIPEEPTNGTDLADADNTPIE